MIASVCIVPVCADDIEPYASSMMESYSASIRTSGDYLQVTFSSFSPNTLNKMGVSYFAIQKKSGSTWNTVYTNNTGYYTYSATAFSKTISCYEFSANSIYRVYAGFYAYNGSSSETKYTYSSTIYT